MRGVVRLGSGQMRAGGWRRVAVTETATLRQRRVQHKGLEHIRAQRARGGVPTPRYPEQLRAERCECRKHAGVGRGQAGRTSKPEGLLELVKSSMWEVGTKCRQHKGVRRAEHNNGTLRAWLPVGWSLFCSALLSPMLPVLCAEVEEVPQGDKAGLLLEF